MFRPLAARVQARSEFDTRTHALLGRRATIVPHERNELDSGLRTDEQGFWLRTWFWIQPRQDGRAAPGAAQRSR
jgi:hypothetical protein